MINLNLDDIDKMKVLKNSKSAVSFGFRNLERRRVNCYIAVSHAQKWFEKADWVHHPPVAHQHISIHKDLLL